MTTTDTPSDARASQPEFDASTAEPNALRYAALTGVYGFGFLAPWSTAGGQLAQLVLMVVALCFVWRHRGWAVRDPIILATGFFLAYVIVRGWIAGEMRPDLFALHWEGVRAWSKAGPVAIVIVGVGLVATGQWLRSAVIALGLWVIGTIVHVLRHWPPQDVLGSFPLDWIAKFRAGTAPRYFFDKIHSEIGLAFGAAVLLLIVFGVSQAVRARTLGRRCAWAVGMAVGVAAFVGLTFVVQTRSTWLAMIPALVAIAVVSLWTFRATLRRYWRSTVGGAVAGLLLMAAIVAPFAQGIVERMQPVMHSLMDTPELLSRERLATVERNSFTRRVGFWVFSMERVAERPLFGFGPGETKYLLKENPVPYTIEDMRNNNLHSSYFQVLVRFGLVGLLPFAFVVAGCVYSAFKLTRREGVPCALGLTAISFAVLFGVWAIANQRIPDFDIYHLYALFLGAPLAPYIAARVARSGAARNHQPPSQANESPTPGAHRVDPA